MVTKITGANFRDRCSTVYDRIVHPDYDVPENLKGIKDWKKDEIIFYQVDRGNNWVFCQPEFIPGLLKTGFDLSDKILFTNRSDLNIHYWDGNTAHVTLGNYPVKFNNLNPLKWYGQNNLANTVECIPLGVNETRKQEDHILDEAINTPVNKEHLLYLNFSIQTNPERVLAERYTKLQNHYGTKSQLEYFLDLKKSYFVISPNGFGVDCHRHWESLYLGAIPVVTRSPFVEKISQFYPMVIIESWQLFDASVFSPELYDRLWSRFDTRYLDIDFLLKKLFP